MRSIRILTMVGAISLAAAPSFAQLYPGEDVTVDPSAIGAAPYHIGEKPIHLRKPGTHVAHHAHRSSSTAVASPKPAATTEAAAAPPVAKPKPKKQTVASVPPPQQQPAPPPEESAMGAPVSLEGTTAQPPAPAKSAKASAPAKTEQLASAEPAPATTMPSPARQAASDAGLTRHGEILFNKGATDPAPAQMDGLKLLASDLSTALKQGATRIQLQAYGGNPGDKSSDARRLSLKRALSIRQVLIDNGVPAGDIDVRAMGGADKGPADRVDVYVRAG